MPAYTVTIRRYTEQVIPGKRLGRHVRKDSRSLAYPYFAPGSRLIETVTHQRHTPILDQGNLGSCVGNAEVGALATSPLYEALPTGTPLDEAEAVGLYSAATLLDSAPGAYPPQDTGTDGTAGSQAALNAGLISGYTHANLLGDVLQALQTGPVLLGIDWYDSFDRPAADGFVEIAPGAQVRGGHEVVARGVDADRKRIFCDNSWGPSWGASGSFSFGWETLHQLLAADGDAVVPVPFGAPPPIPVPVPADADHKFATDPRMQTWAKARHTGNNTYAARAYRTWAAGVR